MTVELLISSLLRAAKAISAIVDTDSPNDIARLFARAAGLAREHDVIVVGPSGERRLLVALPNHHWLVIALASGACGGGLLGTIKGVALESPNRPWSRASLSNEAVRRLTIPRIMLAGLCHKENFPSPRFPLGISDIAASLRA